MRTFDDILSHNQSLVKNENALDFDFIPKVIPHRESEQRQIALAIKPLFTKRNGRNIFIYGPPGVGKTVAAKHVLRDLEDETDEIKTVYVNCWKLNTSYKIAVSICEQIGFRFIQNKNTTDLFKVIAKIINNDLSAVFVFDEIDKVEDTDFLYHLLEGVYHKAIILITNYQSSLANMDERVRSRLTPEVIKFRKYSASETVSILEDRVKYAFYENVWVNGAFELVASKAGDLRDIRSGLFLLREAGYAAEDRSSKTIEPEDVEKALKKFDDFTIKDSKELEDDAKQIYDLVKKHSGLKIGNLFEIYQKDGGTASYKTFQRKIDKLSENKYISTKKQTGKGGNTTIVEKKLTEF